MSYLQHLGVWVAGALGSIWQFVEGNYHNTVFILVALMCIDILSGILKGAKNKRLRSAIMGMGLLKKGAILLSISFAFLLDILVNDSMPVFTTMMTWVAIANEGLSIVENFTALGVSIPKVITDKLATISDEAQELQREKDKKN
ncbi:phage holin family protein [Rummeliibacillus stabekisii]|uniref:phage holin family protein n=1 Tax=Rummeliibacillus stabekisii TaxID=241244 RepID=UPI00371C49EB